MRACATELVLPQQPGAGDAGKGQPELSYRERGSESPFPGNEEETI